MVTRTLRFLLLLFSSWQNDARGRFVGVGWTDERATERPVDGSLTNWSQLPKNGQSSRPFCEFDQRHREIVDRSGWPSRLPRNCFSLFGFTILPWGTGGGDGTSDRINKDDIWTDTLTICSQAYTSSSSGALAVGWASLTTSRRELEWCGCV